MAGVSIFEDQYGKKEKKHNTACWTHISKNPASNYEQAMDFEVLYNTQFAKNWWQNLLFKVGESPVPNS